MQRLTNCFLLYLKSKIGDKAKLFVPCAANFVTVNVEWDTTYLGPYLYTRADYCYITLLVGNYVGSTYWILTACSAR